MFINSKWAENPTKEEKRRVLMLYYRYVSPNGQVSLLQAPAPLYSALEVCDRIETPRLLRSGLRQEVLPQSDWRQKLVRDSVYAVYACIDRIYQKSEGPLLRSAVLASLDSNIELRDKFIDSLMERRQSVVRAIIEFILLQVRLKDVHPNFLIKNQHTAEPITVINISSGVDDCLESVWEHLTRLEAISHTEPAFMRPVALQAEAWQLGCATDIRCYGLAQTQTAGSLINSRRMMRRRVILWMAVINPWWLTDYDNENAGLSPEQMALMGLPPEAAWSIYSDVAFYAARRADGVLINCGDLVVEAA